VKEREQGIFYQLQPKGQITTAEVMKQKLPSALLAYTVYRSKIFWGYLFLAAL